MRKENCFKELSEYINIHSGMNKPELNFQHMYTKFSQFDFTACAEFGEYRNFGKAYEHKIYDMTVHDIATGKKRIMVYKLYTDMPEQLLYLAS